METITKEELKKIAYKCTMNKHINFIKSYHGAAEAERSKNILVNLGYDVARDYMIVKAGALVPVHVVKA